MKGFLFGSVIILTLILVVEGSNPVTSFLDDIFTYRRTMDGVKNLLDEKVNFNFTKMIEKLDELNHYFAKVVDKLDDLNSKLDRTNKLIENAAWYASLRGMWR